MLTKHLPLHIFILTRMRHSPLINDQKEKLCILSAS